MVLSKKMIQGIQKDVTQLAKALGTQHPDPELRIQVGRRVAYGLVTKGKFREPTPEDLKQIAAALQQPATEGIDPDQYGGKVPAIEISRGGELLLRQERDGAVTHNLIQQPLQQVDLPAQPEPAARQPEQRLQGQEVDLTQGIRVNITPESARRVSTSIGIEDIDFQQSRSGTFVIVPGDRPDQAYLYPVAPIQQALDFQREIISALYEIPNQVRSNPKSAQLQEAALVERLEDGQWRLSERGRIGVPEQEINQSNIPASPVQAEANRPEPAVEDQSNQGVATDNLTETISALRSIAEQGIVEARDLQIAPDGSKTVTLAEQDGVEIVATQRPDGGLEVACLEANEARVSILEVDGNGRVQQVEPEIVSVVREILDNQQPTYEQRLAANFQAIEGDAPEQIAEPAAVVSASALKRMAEAAIAQVAPEPEPDGRQTVSLDNTDGTVVTATQWPDGAIKVDYSERDDFPTLSFSQTILEIDGAGQTIEFEPAIALYAMSELQALQQGVTTEQRLSSYFQTMEARELQEAASTALNKAGVEVSVDGSRAIAAQDPETMMRVLAEQTADGMRVSVLEPLTAIEDPEEAAQLSWQPIEVLKTDATGHISYHDPAQQGQWMTFELDAVARGIPFQQRQQTYFNRMDRDNLDYEALKDIDARFDPEEDEEISPEKLKQEPLPADMLPSLRLIAQQMLRRKAAEQPPDRRQLQVDQYLISQEGERLSIARDGEVIFQSQGDQVEGLGVSRLDYMDLHEIEFVQETEINEQYTPGEFANRRIGQIAERMLQPLGPDHPLAYERAQFGDYTIEKDNSALIVRRQAEPIVQIKNGYITDLGCNGADVQAFKQMEAALPEVQPRQTEAGIATETELSQSPLPSSAPAIATSEPSQPADLGEFQPAAAAVEIEQPSISPSGAAAVAMRQAEKLPEGNAKQFVKALSRFGAQILDKGIESYQWLRDEALAYKAFSAFQQAYERTGGKSYEVGGLQISLKGTNHYTLSDNEGELMSYKAHSLPGIKQPVIQMANRSPRLSLNHHGAFSEVNQLFAEGGQEVEYNSKKQKTLEVVRQILTEAPSGACENRRYKLEAKPDGQLQITDKQERSRGEKGLVYGYNDKGKFVDRLGVKDFNYFQGYQERKQNTQAHQPSPPVHSVNGTQVQQLSATLSAHKVLDALGTNIYVGNFYRFDRDQGELRIAARDGRGDVTGRLNDNDIAHINQLAKGIDSDDLACVDFPEQPSQPRQLAYSTASSEIEPD